LWDERRLLWDEGRLLRGEGRLLWGEGRLLRGERRLLWGEGRLFWYERGLLVPTHDRRTRRDQVHWRVHRARYHRRTDRREQQPWIQEAVVDRG
jgi:hypothetical protein